MSKINRLIKFFDSIPPLHGKNQKVFSECLTGECKKNETLAFYTTDFDTSLIKAMKERFQEKIINDVENFNSDNDIILIDDKRRIIKLSLKNFVNFLHFLRHHKKKEYQDMMSTLGNKYYSNCKAALEFIGMNLNNIKKKLNKKIDIENFIEKVQTSEFVTNDNTKEIIQHLFLKEFNYQDYSDAAKFQSTVKESTKKIQEYFNLITEYREKGLENFEDKFVDERNHKYVNSLITSMNDMELASFLIFINKNYLKNFEPNSTISDYLKAKFNISIDSTSIQLFINILTLYSYAFILDQLKKITTNDELLKKLILTYMYKIDIENINNTQLINKFFEKHGKALSYLSNLNIDFEDILETEEFNSALNKIINLFFDNGNTDINVLQYSFQSYPIDNQISILGVSKTYQNIFKALSIFNTQYNAPLLHNEVILKMLSIYHNMLKTNETFERQGIEFDENEQNLINEYKKDTSISLSQVYTQKIENLKENKKLDDTDNLLLIKDFPDISYFYSQHKDLMILTDGQSTRDVVEPIKTSFSNAEIPSNFNVKNKINNDDTLKKMEKLKEIKIKKDDEFTKVLNKYDTMMENNKDDIGSFGLLKNIYYDLLNFKNIKESQNISLIITNYKSAENIIEIDEDIKKEEMFELCKNIIENLKNIDNYTPSSFKSEFIKQYYDIKTVDIQKLDDETLTGVYIKKILKKTSDVLKDLEDVREESTTLTNIQKDNLKKEIKNIEKTLKGTDITDKNLDVLTKKKKTLVEKLENQKKEELRNLTLFIEKENEDSVTQENKKEKANLTGSSRFLFTNIEYEEEEEEEENEEEKKELNLEVLVDICKNYINFTIKEYNYKDNLMKLKDIFTRNSITEKTSEKLDKLINSDTDIKKLFENFKKKILKKLESENVEIPKKYERLKGLNIENKEIELKKIYYNNIYKKFRNKVLEPNKINLKDIEINQAIEILLGGNEPTDNKLKSIRDKLKNINNQIFTNKTLNKQFKEFLKEFYLYTENFEFK